MHQQIQNFEIHCILLLSLTVKHCVREGMVLANLQIAMFNTTLVVPAPSFTADPTLDAIQQERCTAIYGTGNRPSKVIL